MGVKFKSFAASLNFVYETSSPYYSQSNGAIEAAVKTAKRLIKMNEDIDMALLNYRATPLSNGFSPGELMMGRRLKTQVPLIPSLLDVTNAKEVVAVETKLKDKSEKDYNKRHNVKNLPKLKKGDAVWVVDLRLYGTVLKQLSQPRSYLIQTSRGRFRRNRWHLIHAPYKNATPSTSSSNDPIPEDNSGLHNNAAINENSSSEIVTSLNETPNIESNCASIPVSNNPTVTDNIANDDVPVRRPQRINRRPQWMDDYQID